MANWIRTGLMLCVVGCFAVAANSQTVSAAQDRTLIVTGTGTVTAAPDMARLQLGVTAQADSAAEALAENSERMAAVMALLTASGIAAKDIQTSNFSVQPVYERRNDGTPPRISGYTVRNMVHIRLRELDNLGALLDAVVNEGTNTLTGLSFGVSDPDPLQREAEALAVKDAMSRAQGMAEAAGQTLGQVLTIDATSGGGGPQPMMEMAARSADAMAVPVAAGELTLRARIRMTFALAE
ncbi:SIMPL domain-containing protein [Tropicimonas sp. S265A]|uniref:SIMPL domain-containing protein n=1 Tax=Tropicimonas sp. S265A TaxID=3415134 RepID=UPI003C7D965B